jgi:F-type H+-transporting ATPase subunit b
MVSVDGSVFIQIVNFLFLIWVLNVIMYKPIRSVLSQRKEKVTGLGNDIDTFRRDAQEKADAFSSGVREARAKGMKQKEAIMEAASDEEKEIMKKINEKAAAELAKVREKVAKDTEEVRGSLMNEVETFASEISKKILGRAV